MNIQKKKKRLKLSNNVLIPQGLSHMHNCRLAYNSYLLFVIAYFNNDFLITLKRIISQTSPKFLKVFLFLVF